MKIALLSLMLGVASACGAGQGAPAQPAPPSAAKHDDEPEHAALPTRVRLDPRVIVDAKLKTAPVTRAALAATIDLPGEVSFDPDSMARVSALVAGRIESVHCREGQTVKKGDLLVVISVPELGKASAAYTATAAKAAAARANAARLQALAAKRLAAQQEVMSATAEADALEADANAALAQLRALGAGASGPSAATQLRVLAPISGDIVSRDAVVGQPVTPDHILATIADLREVWFLARVFEKSLAQIQVGAAVEIQLNAYPDEKFSGSVEYLGKQVDSSARTVTARIRIANRSDLLRLGLFGVAHVAAATQDERARSAIVVPRSALTEIAGKPVVFVRQPDGDFDLHAVVLGDAALGKVQVLNGLRIGEELVVDGVFTLKSTLLKSTFSEEP
jgi:membrane fusion protein, heavy metal efflux system